MKSKFELGKIRSKNLIVQILAFACNNTSEVCELLYLTSKQMRTLCIENYQWIIRIYYFSIDDLIS